MRRTSNICALAFLAALAVVCGLAPRAAALTQAGEVGGVRFTVYAPDWTWQKRDVNILFIFENETAEPVHVDAALVFPEGKESDFAAGEGELTSDGGPVTLRTSAEAGPNSTERCAMTHLTALDGVPRQVYDFSITLTTPGDTATIAYPLRTIRGAAVSSAQWALYIPVAAALLWSIIIFAAMQRNAARGAWYTPSEPLDLTAEDS